MRYFYKYNHSLRRKCPHLELFWSVFSRIWTECGEVWSISPCSVRMLENTDQNNSEYGNFLCSVLQKQKQKQKQKKQQKKTKKKKKQASYLLIYYLP